MKKSAWPDFLFTLAVRFVGGVILGGLVCFLCTWRGILRAFSHNHVYGPLIWLGICGLTGGLVAVFTVPRWETPWYKRNPDESGVLAELESQSSAWSSPESNVVQKSISIKTVGEDGEEHEYSSMAEVPPEIRAEIESLEKEAQAKGKESSVIETSESSNAFTLKTTRRKDISVYKIVDESGTEQIYHSLEEMPPELRAAIVAADHKSQG